MSEVLSADAQLLSDVCDRAREAGVVGMDTEFERSRTLSARFALLQIGIEGEAWLFDPLQLEDWSALAGLLVDPQVVKVLHSCEEDLEVLFQATGRWPVNLFDTQVAAAFAGLEPSLGYARLTEELLSAQIPKGAQRSDWLARPLSEEQLRYAVLDALYLPQLHALLHEQVAARDMQEFCAEDCQMVVDAARERIEQGYDFRRIKGCGELDGQGLAVLRGLSDWREQRARQSDKPRSWILGDNLMVAIAAARPASITALSAMDDMPASVVRKQGDVLLSCISSASELPEHEWPRPSQRMPSRLQRRWLKALQQEVRSLAEELLLPPSVLVGNRDLNALLSSGYPDGNWQFPKRFSGWRGRLLQPRLEARLQALLQEEVQA